MSEPGFTMLLAGDTILVRPWSHDRDPSFVELIETIRAADVAITNLETVIHEFKGYGQADSGGTYMHSPPSIAAEIAWAGFDLCAHANNHAFDYGSSAVLETLSHARKAGLIIAGAGEDLQAARSPRYFRCNDRNVALVAMASTFVSYAKASRSRSDLHGRPGINPLTVTRVERGLVVPARWMKRATLIATRLGIRIREGERFRPFNGRRVSETDRRANLEAIAEAAANADFVVASIHAHRQGYWLEKFAGEALESGADVVFAHGPHRVGEIELRHGKPIFYCLGDFAYETEHIEKYPSDAYDRLGLGDDATPDELRGAASPSRMLERDSPQVFEGVVATLQVSGRKVERIRLDPIDLGFDAEHHLRGRPRIAGAELSRHIIATIAGKSRKYGTKIVYDAAAGCGEVDCSTSRV